MAPDVDPYRILGLPRGAPMAEVKRAYRQLAKANHPDAAGEAALPRFLAIRAAYDQIVGPAGDGTAAARGGGAGRRASAPRSPWDADPDRTDATHRAYGGRPRRARPAGPRPSSESASTADAGSSSRTRAPRDSKKATPGSTSYDGADAEPFEPDWGGASWYGTTSGTYWTLNPKEYADPRKHGPEYQARARRAADADAAANADAEAAEPVDIDEARAGMDPPPAAEAAPSAPPMHTTTSWWDATAADPAADPAADTDATAAAAADPTPALTTRPDGRPSANTWDPTRFLEPATGGLVGRVGRGVLGWAPIALGIGWLAGEITGCARFVASCDASSAPIAWFAQIVVLALLLIVPRLAVAAAIATIATLAAAVPGSLLVTSMGAAADVGSARAALGGLLVIGWSMGLVVGLGREVRRLRVPGAAPSDHGSGPVS